MGLTETNADQVNRLEGAGRGRDRVSRTNRGVRSDSVQEQALKRQKELRILRLKKPIHVIVRVWSQEDGGDRHSDDDNDERAKKLLHAWYYTGWIPLFVNRVCYQHGVFSLFTQF
jgi:hypothetical protein